VKTPTLITVGEADVLVPAPQSIELYRALKSLDVPTWLYMVPPRAARLSRVAASAAPDEHGARLVRSEAVAGFRDGDILGEQEVVR
jgi:dipeptidyl aminopeptidase/acylaminoacyl peptidase